MRILFGLLPLLLVVACASPPPPPQIIVQTQLIVPSIAPDLFDCGDAPSAPDNVVMQSDVAHYVVALWGWGSECKSHLLAVQQSLATQADTTPAKIK